MCRVEHQRLASRCKSLGTSGTCLNGQSCSGRGTPQIQQRDRNRGTDAGAGILQGLPGQQNGPVVDDHGENHDVEAVPENGGSCG